jgi:hypothetical protein
MKKFAITIIAAAIAACAIAQESYVQLPPNSTGVKLRMRCNTIGADLVCSQGFFLDDGSGSGALGLVGNPLFVTFTNSAIAATQSGVWSVNLGTIGGAATETTLSDVKTGTDRIPSSPATDRATAAAPFSMRLSDGAAFYDARSIRALTSSDVVTVANTGFTVTNSPTVKLSQASTDNDVDVTSSALPANAAQETGGNLATIAGKDFATQTTLALIKAKTDNLDVLLSTRTKPADQQHTIIDSGSISNTAFIANAGTNLNTSALALETGGNLATVKTNTDPLVASGAGGYIRQDSTATIAKESGGNLATIASNTTGAASAANQATQITTEAAINSKLPSTVNGAQPVIIVQNIVAIPPVLTAQQLGNPLLYRAAMKQFCSVNLCAQMPLSK